MLFSQRKGLKPAQKALQVESMDEDLRHGLWSALHEVILRDYQPLDSFRSGRLNRIMGSNLESLVRDYWLSYFKVPTDGIPFTIESVHENLRKYYLSCQWNEAYDFIEFTIQHCAALYRNPFRTFCNAMMERENSGYRFVGNHITAITSPVEMDTIDEALRSPLLGAQRHLQVALAHMSDRRSPDYRNSIKESISAVESLVRSVTGDKKATLGTALGVLQAKIGMHQAMKSAFSSLYGYTSDESGIRHAMSDEPNVSFSDAKFMLVTCSAFVTFVVGKAAENKFELE